MSDVALPEALLALDTYLNPAVATDAAMHEIGAQLSAGRLVVIRDAFNAAFAERMHRALDTCATWRVYEKFEDDFHYHHNIYAESDYPSDLAWCSQIFTVAGDPGGRAPNLRTPMRWSHYVFCELVSAR